MDRAALTARRRRTAAGALLAALLAGCAVGPDFRRPDPPDATRYLPDGAAAALPDGASAPGAPPDQAPYRPAADPQRPAAGVDVLPDWWTRFGSAELDALVRDALGRSPSLRAAQAALRQSEDSLRAGYGVFYPQIGVAANAARQDAVTVLNRTPAATGPYSLATLSASVGYVPDLFGGQRRAVEALGAKVDAQREAYRAAVLALTANVVNTTIARAGYVAQRAALLDVIRMQGDQVRIAAIQFDAGTAAYAPVAALRSQQAANRATVAALEQRIDQATDLLALLGGRAPAAAQPPAVAFADLAVPLDLPDTLPSSLARHRPDILMAEADLHVASAQIGVATADLFPSLTLGAGGGEAHSRIGALLQAGTRYWSLQAGLAATLFSGGSQWYARRAAIDAYDAALAQYDQTVLAALDQVADALRALEHDTAALQADVDAQDAAAESLKLARANYEAGTAGYLDLLTADAQFQQARLAVYGAAAQRLQDTVALYVALGGGWWNDPQAAN